MRTVEEDLRIGENNLEKIAGNQEFLEVLKSPLINVTSSKVSETTSSDQELWLTISHYEEVIEDTLPGNAKQVFKYYILDGS